MRSPSPNQLLVLLPLLASPAAAQRGFDFGVVGGVNRNTMTGVGPVEARYTGQVGLFAAFPASRYLSFRPEASVSWKRVGTRQAGIILDDPCPITVLCSNVEPLETTSLTWLEVPLLMQVSLSTSRNGLVPRLYGGPFVAVRLGCSVSSEFDDQPVPLSETASQTAVARVSYGCDELAPARFDNGDAGFVVGGALKLREASLGLRWTRSLLPAMPQHALQSHVLSGGKQSTLSLTLELATRLGRR